MKTGDEVPVPHAGLALTVEQFHDLAQRLKDHGIDFIIKPHLRFQGQPGEQYTMFLKVRKKNPSMQMVRSLCVSNLSFPLTIFSESQSLSKDPSGNNLEFKAMTKIDNLFAKYNVVDNPDTE